MAADDLRPGQMLVELVPVHLDLRQTGATRRSRGTVVDRRQGRELYLLAVDLVLCRYVSGASNRQQTALRSYLASPRFLAVAGPSPDQLAQRKVRARDAMTTDQLQLFAGAPPPAPCP